MTPFHYPLLDTKFRFRVHNIISNIIQQYLPTKSHILDLGCAGGNIAKLTQGKHLVTGVENNSFYFQSARKHCHKFLALDLNRSQDIKKIPNHYDLVVLADVLEHLVNPSHTLKHIIPKAKKNALMIISLPNIAQLPFRLSHLFGNFNYSDHGGVMDETHLHFYTLKTAKQLIRQFPQLKIIKIFPAGTLYSFLPIFPTLIAPQFVFLIQKN